ncbi:hypothetical protein FA95DRAFT_1562764 [Auriscalpium vulgare]|uniref:Uncharacterized protein n=1 Tax=Auriscalpium vulgare TaxID=40419 RepID=A0ACB8RKA9_9AGAM|nr:hypothetical protein FA95DRAFT_1562764 [Auriscalpium vulgare]
MRFFALLALAAAAATASPVSTVSDVVVSPAVTAPVAGAVWPVHSTQLVTWDTAHIPPAGSNNTGLVLLGHGVPGSDSENLDIDHPLASGFKISDGSVEVVTPDVAPDSAYFVVLFGDSGNRSPAFTIASGTGAA